MTEKTEQGDNDIKVIVLTGGPCAGKTTLIDRLREQGEIAGYKLMFVPEAATMLLSNKFRIEEGNERFQRAIVSTQKFLEDTTRAYAEDIGRPVAIICDRGLLDNSAFIEYDALMGIISDAGISPDGIFDRYDMVLHLQSTALGAQEHYSKANNPERRESVDESLDLEMMIRYAWFHHPNRHIVEDVTNFEAKMNWAIAKITEELEGKPAKHLC